MCAFISRPHQANPHMLQRRNLCRAGIFSTTEVRASRPSSGTFRSTWKFLQQLPSKVFRTRFRHLNTPELSYSSHSKFVARSLGTWGFEFLQAESLLTLSGPLQSTEISNTVSGILENVTPIDVLSFTFVSTILGIMAAYIVHELKDHADSPATELLNDNRQSNPRIVNSSSTLRNAVASDTADVWLNFSRSSPFFRSVSARCPSLSASAAYQYVQKLEFKNPEFQRQCLPAPDGGTVALDWPSHLDFEGSKELENIMLLVCGTTEGSQEDGIVNFSQLVEQHGYFPIVFNPRGCGGSALTTPRVFSAADSDDVRLAVQFIANSRPSATILGIGWGLGANVLARYLGEEGSYTPLTAAVCIDNPFDLSSVTRPVSDSRWVDFNLSLSRGLVQILESSKMLFQGEKRGFDVSRALAATSVRDFDQAISRVVHGYTTVEDFYANTSSGTTLEGVQIPLLCILHLEDYTRRQASIPQHAFETNAYTMLLVSSPSDSRDDHPGAASDWTHAISLEWLTAVEICMLKGRHPHLSEFSPTIKLPRERSNFKHQYPGESLESKDKSVATKVPGTNSDNFDHKEVAFKDAGMRMNSIVDPSHLQKGESIGRSSLPSKASHGDGAKAPEISDSLKEGQKAEHQLPVEGLTEEEEAERGQVVQVTETVMNVLDVTMPGTLADAQKQQVLKAVGRGETIVTALEEAVPEDVRGKMSTAVSEVVHAQGLNLKTAGSQPSAPMLPAGVTDSIQGRLLELTGEKVAPKSVVDVSSRSGDESREDIGMSGKTGQNDDTTKEITPDKNDKSNTTEQISLNNEIKGSDKDTVARNSDEKLEPSKEEHMPSKDPKDRAQQLETENQSSGGNKGSGDLLSSGSPDVGDQPHDQGDQGENKQEQPRGSVDGALEERKETSSEGGSALTSALTSDSDNPANKINGGDSGQGHSSASERKDTAKDMISPADSEEGNGRSVTEKNAKMPKDAESKGEVSAPPSNDDLQTPQSDPPKASGATPNAQPPDLQVPKGDLTNSKGPDNDSPASVSQAGPSTDVPADMSNSSPPSPQVSQSDRPRAEIAAEASNSPPPSSQASQNDSPRPEMSLEAPNSQPSNSQASQTDTQQMETTTAPPSSPPEDSAPAPAFPAPQNPPPQTPPVPLPSVGEALQALTGFDDSTQMAVTNVFGVVENVLDQLEKDNASAEGDSSTKVPAGNMLNDATAELTKRLAQNANMPEDEERNDQGNSDNQSKDVALVPNNQHKGSRRQSLAEGREEGREERNELKSTESPLEVEGMDHVNSFSRIIAANRGVKPLSKNRRGYIMDTSGQQTEPGSHEEQNNPPNAESSPSESIGDPVHDCAAEDIVENGSFAESANERRLEAMAAEIDAEGEEAAESSPSDQVAADDGVSGVQEKDSSPVADLVMNAVKLEVLRRLGSAGLEACGVDLEKEVVKVAHVVSEVVTMGKDKLLGATSHELQGTQGLESDLGGKVGVLNGNRIVTALSSVLGSKSLLGKLLPFGVLAGVVLAALGATYLIVADDQEEESVQIKKCGSQIKNDTNSSSSRRIGVASANYRGEPDDEAFEELGDDLAGSDRDGAEHVTHSTSSEKGEHWNEVDGVNGSASTDCSDKERKSTVQTAESKPPHQGKLMGAMAAAMGATAAVASSATSTSEDRPGHFEQMERSEQNLVPGIAEKAISIVSPVIPKTEAGDLDQERLVGVLTEVGQKGGPLTLVGKIALLWGGLRGAMSLVDRLLAFLRMKERPLHERLLGFGVMSILLWTPVLVPLLPTLLQQWATKSPSGVADAAAGIGLYGAVFILVTIWGRRVRGYDRPLVSYGLQFFSRAKLRLFAGGLAIGFGTVSGYYVVNWVLGYSQFTWDAIVVTNPEFPGALASTILTSWKVLILVTQSLTKAVAVALEEEVLFRAWLQEEIAVDLGYHWAVILSALAFAVVHWSPTAFAGLWFFAVALAGARARTNGDLNLAIGIHAGIVTTFAVMNLGGLVYYIPETPTWITGANAGNPWAGALGTGMVAAMAVTLYPREQASFPEEK